MIPETIQSLSSYASIQSLKNNSIICTYIIIPQKNISRNYYPTNKHGLRNYLYLV